MTMQPQRQLLVALSLAALLLSPMVHASPSDTDKAQARQLVDLGDGKFASGDYRAALDAYRGADLLMGVPTTALQVARAELALSRLIEAKVTLERVIDHPPSEREPKAFEQAREQAQQLSDALATRIPTLEVQVTGVPSGAAAWVSVDGARWSDTQLAQAQPLNPGEHEVAAWLEGRPKSTQRLTLAEGKHEVVQLAIAKREQPATVRTALSPLVWIGFSVAGGGLLIGTITGAVSLDKASEVKDQCFEGRICEQGVEETRDDSVTLAHVSTVSFIVGGAGALVGLIGLIVGGEKITEPTSSWHVDSDGLTLRF
jgi:hypothetical protein